MMLLVSTYTYPGNWSMSGCALAMLRNLEQAKFGYRVEISTLSVVPLSVSDREKWTRKDPDVLQSARLVDLGASFVSEVIPMTALCWCLCTFGRKC